MNERLPNMTLYEMLLDVCVSLKKVSINLFFYLDWCIDKLLFKCIYTSLKKYSTLLFIAYINQTSFERIPV